MFASVLENEPVMLATVTSSSTTKEPYVAAAVVAQVTVVPVKPETREIAPTLTTGVPSEASFMYVQSPPTSALWLRPSSNASATPANVVFPVSALPLSAGAGVVDAL